MSGIVALPGPPVILTYMSSLRPASLIRGNTMLYLFFVDIFIVCCIFVKGLASFAAICNWIIFGYSIYSRWIIGAKVI